MKSTFPFPACAFTHATDHKFLLWMAVGLALSSLSATTLDYFPQSVASGDPRPESVVLWTRGYDPTIGTDPQMMQLQVATDQDFTNVVKVYDNLPASSANDYCVKVLVEGLNPATTYYYRFNLGAGKTSPVGRTKTAPAAGSSQPLKFAVLNCQDYVGRYYNTLADLLQRHPDLDFIVHVGDYIYETTGDPQFQQSHPGRAIEFRDQAGAIQLGRGNEVYYAASSLDNYRQLYQTYRSDPVLRKLHESFPFIAIWDDHEYSDDSWREVSTYYDGWQEEINETRKRNAERAYFEYMPVSVGATATGTSITSAELFPNTMLYRYFDFGNYLRLLVPDYRTFRPDHIIPEDAFPGRIVMDQSSVRATLKVALNLDDVTLDALWHSSLKNNFDPYLNIDDPANASLKIGMQQIIAFAYMLEGLPPMEAAARASEVVTGNLSVDYINNAFAAAELSPPVSEEMRNQLPRGLSYLYMGKTDLFSDVGSRYFVVRASYKLYAGYRALFDPNVQNAYGAAQLSWLQQALGGSTAAWNILASSVSFCPIGVDFSDSPLPLPAEFPSIFRQNFQLNADHWDGFPNGRSSIIDLLSTKNSMIISGDIHSSFVTNYTSLLSRRKVAEFTASSVSSETFQEIARSLAIPLFGGIPGVDQLVSLLDVFIYDAVRKENAGLLYANTGDVGYLVVEIIDGTSARAQVHTLPVEMVYTDLTAPEMYPGLWAAFHTRSFWVEAGAEGAVLDTWPVPQMTENPFTGLQTGWFGDLDPGYQPWVWHTRLGWLYIVPAPRALGGGIFVYTPGLGWLYTGPLVYPNFYDFSGNRWLFYASTSDPRYFYDYRADRWIAVP